MSLRDRLSQATAPANLNRLFAKFGFEGNPFPASSQTTDNPHRRSPSDDAVDQKIESFVRDHKTQVIVIEGSQGVGKTNILNYYERELRDVLPTLGGFYVVRYLADPESSFDSILRRLFQELGNDHLRSLGEALHANPAKADEAIEQARNYEVRIALRKLATSDGAPPVVEALHEWFMGLRLLKIHREILGVNFRIDTVEAKTAAFRDLVQASSTMGLLNGVFLLLDELEKQDGVLSATAVARYLSSMRAIIDALPNHLFMMLAVTPDALRRYSLALPAFRSRLENRIELQPLLTVDDALELAHFYVNEARTNAQKVHGKKGGSADILDDAQIAETFSSYLDRAKRRNDTGLRQREFLSALHELAETQLRQ